MKTLISLFAVFSLSAFAQPSDHQAGGDTMPPEAKGSDLPIAMDKLILKRNTVTQLWNDPGKKNTSTVELSLEGEDAIRMYRTLHAWGAKPKDKNLPPGRSHAIVLGNASCFFQDGLKADAGKYYVGCVFDMNHEAKSEFKLHNSPALDVQKGTLKPTPAFGKDTYGSLRSCSEFEGDSSIRFGYSGPAAVKVKEALKGNVDTRLACDQDYCESVIERQGNMFKYVPAGQQSKLNQCK